MPIRNSVIALVLLALLASGARADGISNAGSIPVGQIPGTNTNNNAAAGNVGEIITATIAQGSAVTLATGTPTTIMSVSLTAGDWDCNAVAGRTLGATTSYTIIRTSLVTVTNTDGTIATGTMVQFSTPAAVPVTDLTQQIGAVRFSLAVTTSVFLTGDDVFTVSTDKGYGFLRCRRMR